MDKVVWHTSEFLNEENKSLFHFSFLRSFSEVYASINSAVFQVAEINLRAEKFYLPCLLRKGKLLNTIQLLYAPVNVKGELVISENEKEILDVFVAALMKDKKVDRILQPAVWSLFQGFPENSTVAPFGSYQINLENSEEELWKALHSKHRNVVRNAEKKGASILSGEEAIARFYKLYKGTMERNDMFLEPQSYFEKLGASQVPYYCGVVHDDNHDIGGVFIPYTQHGAYYVYGGSEARISLTGAMNFLHYKAMLALKGEGVELYDFVGARFSNC